MCVVETCVSEPNTISCRVLILQLKRYQYDPVKGIFFKLKDPVTLPALIDLESYCVNNITEPPVFNAPHVVTEEKENFKSESPVNLQVKNEFSYRKCGEVSVYILHIHYNTYFWCIVQFYLYSLQYF